MSDNDDSEKKDAAIELENGETVEVSEEELNQHAFLSLSADSSEMYFHDTKGETILTLSRKDATVTWTGTPSEAARVFVDALEKLLRERIVKN